jgi:hypothetical protein
MGADSRDLVKGAAEALAKAEEYRLLAVLETDPKAREDTIGVTSDVHQAARFHRTFRGRTRNGNRGLRA